MPHRDPDTGQFVSDSGEQFDDFEVVNIQANAGVEASNLSGATSFQGDNDPFSGLNILDYDEIVDRNEELHLITAWHVLNVYANSTETADGTVAGAVEVSTSPATSVAVSGANTATIESPVGGRGDSDDSIDVIGRPLQAVGHAPFSDGATGTGGGGSAGHDEVKVEIPDLGQEAARFHPRDDLFLNGELRSWNISDSGIHLNCHGQHVYGVMEA